MEMIQVVAVGMIGAVLSLILKKQSPEFSLLVGIATGILIFLMIASELGQVLSMLKELAETAGINLAYLGIVMKVIGIAYIAEFGIQLCQDAGEKSIAAKIELAGKVVIMMVSAPVLLALMDLVIHMVA